MKVRLYPCTEQRSTFAEETLTSIMERSNTGVCFSGGGTRAMSAAWGQLRGLHALGLLKHVRYISSVSGGSWASVPFTYFRQGPEDDQAFLGEVLAPEDITMENLKALDEKTLGFCATQSFKGALFDFWKEDYPSDKLWSDTVGKIFLEPFGLFQQDDTGYFSYDQETVSKILQRNPELAESSFLTVREDRPYLIINSSLLGPSAMAPFDPEIVVGFQHTPLYSGTPASLSVAYQPIKGEAESVMIGSGFVESFALNSNAPTSLPVDDWAETNVPESPFALCDATGASSAAFAGFVDQHHLLGMFSSTTALTPKAEYWPVSESVEVSSREFSFGDGGVIENYGLPALLQRKVTTAVVFINTATPLGDSKDMSTFEKGKEVDTYLPTLFGFQVPSVGTYTSQNQVFPKDEFESVIRGLQEAKKGQKTVMTVTEHQVQDNGWWGIEGGWTVKVCWCYLDRVGEWEAQLNKEISHDIAKGNHRFFSSGPFKNFPNYDTVDQNFLDLLELTPEQVSLLGHLCAWNITSNEELFQALLK